MTSLRSGLSLILVDYGCPSVKALTTYLRERVREVNVFKENELTFHNVSQAQGMILSGGPSSVRDRDHLSPIVSYAIATPEIPVLGICYGAQLVSLSLGGQVVRLNEMQKGWCSLPREETKLTEGTSDPLEVYLSHQDAISSLDGVEVLMKRQDYIYAFQDFNREVYGVQFHPEAFLRFDLKDANGERILSNFLEICTQRL